MVPTTPLHQEHRQAIRQTWGHRDRLASLNVRIAFLFGLTSKTEHQIILETESRLHRDIIQSSAFDDTYMNLTQKSISMLRWTNQYCQGVELLLKSDDDMFVRIDNLLGYFEKEKAKLGRSIFGDLIYRAKPIRNKSSKWYISPSQYSKTFYPNYTSGTAYAMSGRIIPDLAAAAARERLPYVPWEDVFVTGVLAERVGARRFRHNGFTLQRRRKDPCAYADAVTGHHVPPQEIIWLWEETKKLIRSNRTC